MVLNENAPHKNLIIDSDVRFIIDPTTRAITTESKKLRLVKTDHNCERFSFEIPRIVEGHDMMDCSKVEVHYINISANKTEISSDFYPVTDLQVSSEDDGAVTFSWLISANATKYEGTLSFAVRFVCLNGEKVEYALNTTAFRDIYIDAGINNSEEVVAEYSDVLEEWYNRLFGLATGTLSQINNEKEKMLSEIELAAKIVQNPGVSETAVMSQKAVTDTLAEVFEVEESTPNVFDPDNTESGNYAVHGGSFLKEVNDWARRTISPIQIPSGATNIYLYTNADIADSGVADSALVIHFFNESNQYVRMFSRELGDLMPVFLNDPDYYGYHHFHVSITGINYGVTPENICLSFDDVGFKSYGTIVTLTGIKPEFLPSADQSVHQSMGDDDSLAMSQKAATGEFYLNNNIPNTDQTIGLDENGRVATVTHTDGEGNVVRTDAFTYTDQTVTEVRTLADGTTRTITFNFNTLEIEVQ